MSGGKLVGGNTGGTLAGKESAAAVTIKLDFPVPLSPATTMRTRLKPPIPPPPAIKTANTNTKTAFTLVRKTLIKSKALN